MSTASMRFDQRLEIVYGSPADTVYIDMAPTRGATLISETETAWTWIGGGVVQIIPTACYVQLNAEQIEQLEEDPLYRLGGIPDGDVIYMKVDEFDEFVARMRRRLITAEWRLLP